jgi:hypothetical protein
MARYIISYMTDLAAYHSVTECRSRNGETPRAKPAQLKRLNANYNQL